MFTSLRGALVAVRLAATWQSHNETNQQCDGRSRESHYENESQNRNVIPDLIGKCEAFIETIGNNYARDNLNTVKEKSMHSRK